MPLIRPHTPSAAERREQAESGAFQTHAAYVRAFALLAGFRDGESNSAGLSRSLRLIRASPSLEVRPVGTVSQEDVWPILASAWGTELLLALNRVYAKDEELIRVSNNWCVVQLYYVIYHGTQALTVARGRERPTTHLTTQRIFMDNWVTKPLYIPPWTYGYGPRGFRNVPEGRPIRDVHPWIDCNPDSCWDIAGKALRTTRLDALEELFAKKRLDKQRARRRAWREEEQARIQRGRKPRREPTYPLPILSGDEKDEGERSLRDFTTMDYFYRLRIKANYQDGSMFIDGPRDDASSRLLRANLIRLAACSLLLNELHIMAALGKERMVHLVDRWLNSAHPEGMNLGVMARADILRSF